MFGYSDYHIQQSGFTQNALLLVVSRSNRLLIGCFNGNGFDWVHAFPQDNVFEAWSVKQLRHALNIHCNYS